ncbi:MAG TPA: hypothetical protein VFM18_04295 [Methanosarcina sp.]|nr:hypothetical protein [Methanosarcina sp.]
MSNSKKLGHLHWQFGVGLYQHTRVTVKSETYDNAVLKARQTMDNRYSKMDLEPPVCWDLTILKAYRK